mgnify:CR=1 FL=1
MHASFRSNLLLNTLIDSQLFVGKSQAQTRFDVSDLHEVGSRADDTHDLQSDVLTHMSVTGGKPDTNAGG